MPSTEGRSRDEWLAVVKERGERLRRRRRLTLSAAGAVALLVPALAFGTLSPGRDGAGPLQVAAGGSTPATGDVAGPSGEAGAGTTTTVLAGMAESVPPAGPLYSTTTVAEPALRVDAVHNRTEPPSGPTTTRVVDDPVVRPAPGSVGTIPPSGSAGGSSSATGSSNGTAVATPPPDPSTLPVCPVPDVRVTVTTEKAAYAAGETVRFSSTLENRSGTACMVSGRAFFSVEDGAGKTVSSFAYTANFMLPVKAEPGQTFTNTGSWDQQDCSGPRCTQVPPGTYAVVAGWTEAGPYTGRGSFQIGA